ncbi:MAG: hypothetical protein NVS2B9_06990 [Myxococcales bacterium]
MRLTPIAVSAEAAVDVSALSDRDTTTALSLSAPIAVTFTFAHEVTLSRLKAYGARGLSVEVEALGPFSLDGGDVWQKVDLTASAKRKQWTVSLTRQGVSTATLAELELWGVGSGSAPSDPQALATASASGVEPDFDNLAVVRSSSGSAMLEPGPRPCAPFLFDSQIQRAAIHRAFRARQPISSGRKSTIRKPSCTTLAPATTTRGSSDGQALIPRCLRTPEERRRRVSTLPPT